MKAQSKKWPRLLNTNDYCPFLQEEFLDNSSSHDDRFDECVDNSKKNIPSSFRRAKNKNFGRRKKQSITPEEIKRIYLFLYNLFQFVGFIYILVVLSIRYAKEGAGNYFSFLFFALKIKIDLILLFRFNTFIL